MINDDMELVRDYAARQTILALQSLTEPASLGVSILISNGMNNWIKMDNHFQSL